MSTFQFTAAPGPADVNANPDPTLKTSQTKNTRINPTDNRTPTQKLLDGFKGLSLLETQDEEGDDTPQHIYGAAIKSMAEADVDSLFDQLLQNGIDLPYIERRTEIVGALSNMLGPKDATTTKAVFEAAKLFHKLDLDIADDEALLQVVEYVLANPDSVHRTVCLEAASKQGPLNLVNLSDLATTLAVAPKDPSPVSSRSSSASFRSVNQRRSSRQHR